MTTRAQRSSNATARIRNAERRTAYFSSGITGTLRVWRARFSALAAWKRAVAVGMAASAIFVVFSLALGRDVVGRAPGAF
jgi:hypothetical protein